MKHIKLFETYNSHNELVMLAKQILHVITTETIENGIPIKKLAFINIGDLNFEGYNEILSFLQANKKLQIIIDSKYLVKHLNLSPATKGVYAHDDINKVIVLKEKYNTLEVLNKDNDHIPTCIYFMNNSYLSTLLHELQHAYDDYRSKGKFSGDYKGYNENNPKEYLNSKHEVDARFNQAVLDTKLKEWVDMDENGFIYELKPFNVCLKEFRSKLSNYRILPLKEKKRLDKKFAQYYVKYRETFNPNEQE